MQRQAWHAPSGSRSFPGCWGHCVCRLAACAGSLARPLPLSAADPSCCPPTPPTDAYGLVLRHEQGWSLAYSGDTQPCQQLVQASGRGGVASAPERASQCAAAGPACRSLQFCAAACLPLPMWCVLVPLPLQAGRGCSLLIHEATFEPCLEQQARAKRHSTTAEALQVAQVRSCCAAWCWAAAGQTCGQRLLLLAAPRLSVRAMHAVL